MASCLNPFGGDFDAPCKDCWKHEEEVRALTEEDDVSQSGSSPSGSEGLADEGGTGEEELAEESWAAEVEPQRLGE